MTIILIQFFLKWGIHHILATFRSYLHIQMRAESISFWSYCSLLMCLIFSGKNNAIILRFILTPPIFESKHYVES